MIVDGKDLTKKFKGKIRFGQQTIQPRQIKTYTEWTEHSLNPNRQWNPEPQFFDVIIEMIVSGNTKTEAEILISDATSDFINGDIFKLDNAELSIRAEVTGIEKEFIKRWDYKVTVTMQGWEKSAGQHTVAINGTLQTVSIEGNQPTPCIVEITPSVDLASVDVDGIAYNHISGDKETITIRNLKAGKTVIINGEDCTVLQEGANKFADTDMWEFPVLKSGANTISCSSDKCTVTLKYKPRYV